MADLTLTKPSPLVGLPLPFVSADPAGDTVPGTAKQVVFRNTNAAARVVSVVSQVVARPGVAADDIEINVPATNGVVIVAGLNASEVINPDGRIALTYSAAAGLEIAVLG